MKTRTTLVFALASLWLMAMRNSQAAETTFNLSLATPQLQNLHTSIPVGSATVEVSVNFIYDTRGKVLAAGDSTVNSTPATCTGTAVKRGTNVNYALTIKAATTPSTTIVLRGVLGAATSVATYSGPEGRTKISAQPVAITSLAPVPARVDLSSAVNAKGQISGTGNILAYGTNSSVPGKLRGVVKTNKLNWVLTQAPRVVSFKGDRSNDVYVGSLKVTVAPDRETIQPLQVPASAFPVANGVASFRGMILTASNSLPTAAEGVKVTIKSDINGDGQFLGKEIASTTTDAQGHYQLSLPVLAGRPVLMEMSLAGFAKYLMSYPSVTAGAAVVKNQTLQALTSLTVNSGNAQSDDGKFALMGLPANVTAVDARVFNPVTETAQFPGEFADNENNLLVSSVFSAIEAKDSSGDAVTSLGTNALLRMEVPRDTWKTLGDLTAGNGQLDVPLYFYDESAGQWKRNAADGWLEDTNHAKIPEAQLASIQSGSYDGGIYCVGPITHLSWWNLDWPISSHTCIRGFIVDPNTSQPIAGASVVVRGLTYTGSSSLLTTTDGGFCNDIMRSESPGEDVDRNGVTGETQQVQILVQRGTNLYVFGPYNSPLTQATCGAGNGLDGGLLSLAEANRLTLTSCTVTGRMVYSGTAFGGTSPLNAGDPLVGAFVFGYDSEAADLLGGCMADGSCGPGTTDADGYFSFTTLILSSLTVYGSKTEDFSANSIDSYSGTSTFLGCPSGPITLSADFKSLRFFTFDLTGDNITDGTFSLFNNQPLASFSLNGTTYVGTNPTSQSAPTSLGPWLTLNLINAGNASSAGTMTFTVTSLSPISGTWTTSTLGVSGAFAEQAF